MPITLFFTPVGSVSVLAAGFLLHRIFDITKPPPARRFERLPEGLGIQADDWVAGLYSNAVLQMLLAAGALPAGY
jgi:phosphatidylglycerophosphatase A